MAGIVVAPYPTEAVQGRPESTGLPAGNAPVSAFGPTLPNEVRQVSGVGQDLERAGAKLEQASGNAAEIALGMMKVANETAVQDLNNKFITAQQQILYTGDNAFYKQQGKDAIDAAPATTSLLQDLQKTTLDQAANPAQRERLTAITNYRVGEATNGISQHVIAQAAQYQKTVAAGSINGAATDAALNYNDADKIHANAFRAETSARALAKSQGLAGTPAEDDLVAQATGKVYGDAIQARLANGDNRGALGLYNQVRPKLDAATIGRLDGAMKSTETQVKADDWTAQHTPHAGAATIRAFFESKGYSAVAAAALAGNFQSEGGIDPNARNPKDGRDGSDSIGIGQWNAERARALQKFAADNKLDPKSTQTQLEFANWELNNSEKATGDALKGATTIDQANAAAVGYFRPAGWTPQNPQGTNSYADRLNRSIAVFGDKGVGFQKADTQSLVSAALNDPSLSPEVKSRIVTDINKNSAAVEAARSATIKGTDNAFEATAFQMMTSPGSVPPGALAPFAAAYRATGDYAKAQAAETLAAMEGTLRNFSGAAKDAQEEAMRVIAKHLLPGKAGSLAEGLLQINNKDRGDAGKQATQEFEGIKTAIETVKVDPATLQDKAKGAIGLAIQAKDFTKAQEIANYYDGAVTAHAAGQAPPTQQTQFIQSMRDQIEAGKADNHTITQAAAMDKTYKTQQAEFDKDAYATGTKLYPQVGVPVPINLNNPDPAALVMRAAQAHQISALQNNRVVLPLSQDEIATLRNTLAQSPADQQAKIMIGLSALPADMIPHVAAALAGTKDSGDPASRAYAASMAMFAERDPVRAVTANQVLKGAELIRAGGASGLKPAVQSDTWQQEMQTQIGASWKDMKPAQQAVLADTIGAHYTYLMHQAGRQGDKTDTDILDKSIKAVVGTRITMNRSAFYPPARDMTYYEFDNVMGRLTDGDLDGVRTKDGTPVTADLVRREGKLTNVGEGLYIVRIPDPRNGGVPGEIPLPHGQRNQLGGEAWLLDGKALMQRTPAGPSRDPNAPDYVAAPSLGGRR